MARERGQWSSRAAFIVAAIGSAIGFGNVWRFPTLAYDYGGGAFFIPYLLALFVIGIPITIVEIAVGQYYQTGDAGAFGKINKRFRGVGIGSVLCAFLVTTYYCVLLAWVLVMFVYSILGSEGRWKGVSGSEAFDWFVGTVTGLDTAGENLSPTRLVGATVGALAVVWLTIFACIAFGVKWTGRIAYFTVGIPVLIIIVLLVRAVTLPGSSDGIRAYIGEWDVSVLSERPAVWSEAVTQVFFSLGVTFGILTAYASYNKRDSPVFSNSIIIALSNSIYSVIAGFAVFGTIGYLANLEGKDVDDLGTALGGPGLMFGTYPVALSTLPGSGHWERLLFIALFLLGIDSGFALAEGVTTVFHDTLLLRNVPRVFVTAGVCTAGFLGGLLYCTDTGLIFLDVADFYINFIMLLIGFFECFSVGWIYGIDGQIANLGLLPVWGYLFATYIPVCLASGLWFGSSSGAIWKGFVGLIVAYVLMLGILFVLLSRAKKNNSITLSWKEIVLELFMGNVLELRRELVGVVKYIPLAWFFLIRHVIPPILLILFANLAVSKNAEGKRNFGNYSSFPVGYQAMGISIVVLTCVAIALGVVVPFVYACFDISAVRETDYENKEMGFDQEQKVTDEERQTQTS